MVTVRIAKEKIKNLVQELRKHGYHPQKAILFGSVARHSAHIHSDIDVALWDDRFTGCLVTDYEAIAPFLRGYSGVELHTFNSCETAGSNPFIDVIEKTGIEIDMNEGESQTGLRG